MPYLTQAQLHRDLAERDLTDPNEGHHAIQLLAQTAINALAEAWRCEVRVDRGSRIVSIADNYDNLGFEPGAVSRDQRYTRYLDEQQMLRSHSSAAVPSALRQLSNECSLDLLLVCPGIVYRRDSIDRLHTGTPHQMDMWRVTTQPLNDEDMDEMIAALVEAMTPGLQYRCESREHPYTRNGRQVDVLWDGEWVEIAECGLASESVLRTAGLTHHYGLALGMGLDRLLMMKKGVPDIRLLRSSDPRITTQMDDLNPYRQVSSMPGIRRDMSVAVDADDTAEDLGDRIRNALGKAADVVEEVSLLSETSYGVLPSAARQRLGISEHQKNVLVRVVLRSLDRTLTDDEANILRDRIYSAVHQGSASLWASESRSELRE